MTGIFQYDEKQDCDELFSYAKLFDAQIDAALALTVIKFAATCSIKVGLELASYIKRLQENSFEFSRIKKHTDFVTILAGNMQDDKKKTILKMLRWFLNTSAFK